MVLRDLTVNPEKKSLCVEIVRISDLCAEIKIEHVSKYIYHKMTSGHFNF